MTSIPPVQPYQPMSKAKKAAITTGAVVGTIGVASAVAAFALGKGKVDATGIKKILPALAEGYKTMGSFIAKKATGAFKATKSFVGEAATRVKDFVGKAATGVKDFFANIFKKGGEV